MTARRNRQILLASRPRGEPTPDNFKLVETDVPEPGPGQMLLQFHPGDILCLTVLVAEGAVSAACLWAYLTAKLPFS
ncbi:MAG: hypothetical protein ACYC3I_06935 [Gemmataceae bacterium]